MTPFLVAAAALAGQLAANRSDLWLDGGRLAGPGAQVIRSAAEGTQYVFLGEDHGIAEVARFAAALASEPPGFETLALEIGPSIAAHLNGVLKAPDPAAAHAAFLAAHPMSVPFYNTQEEFDFLQKAHLRIVGFDQELMGNAKLLLESVRKAPVEARVDKLLAAERTAAAEAVKTGRPDLLYMMTAPRSDLTGLQAALREARLDSTPIDDLLASRDVYESFMKGAGYESNVARSLLMRKYFARAAPSGRMMLKAGGEHAFKGLNPLNNRDLGNHVAELAEGRGQRSLHILIVGAGGQQLMFAGAGRPMQPMPIDIVAKDSQLAALDPLVVEAVKHERWSLFDLRPLRPHFSGAPELAKLVYGFELIAIVPKATPSHELR